MGEQTKTKFYRKKKWRKTEKKKEMRKFMQHQPPSQLHSLVSTYSSTTPCPSPSCPTPLSPSSNNTIISPFQISNMIFQMHKQTNMYQINWNFTQNLNEARVYKKILKSHRIEW